MNVTDQECPCENSYDFNVVTFFTYFDEIIKSLSTPHTSFTVRMSLRIIIVVIIINNNSPNTTKHIKCSWIMFSQLPSMIDGNHLLCAPTYHPIHLKKATLNSAKYSIGLSNVDEYYNWR